MATDSLDKLRGLLNELFLLNDPELDFGIYRVMNARRKEIERFRDKELGGAVTRALSTFQDLDRSELEKKIAEERAFLKQRNIREEVAPDLQELLRKLDAANHVDDIANEVFGHLYAFFSRYYQSGDFHCRRQFRDGTYAIPYEGEEVRLFWANADQYYIKTARALRPYEFTLTVDGLRARFEVVGGAEERDNTKSARVFQLSPSPFVVDGKQLTLRFVYRMATEGETQESLDATVIDALKSRTDLLEWSAPLLTPNGDGTTPKITRHFKRFRQRETFDYFIHKRLGAFLRQELDYYLKTEVMRLDEIAHPEVRAPRVEEYLSKLRVMWSLGNTLIDFMAQLENFQKRLWLKKKFVFDTHWLVSVGLIPKELHPRVLANAKQREAWVKWLCVDKIAADLEREGYCADGLSEKFLEQNPSLVLDTSLFDHDFTADLLAALGDTEEKTLGLLVHGENFQALQLLQERYREKVKCVYIDPPYNTGGDGFQYKDSYQHSSWLAMMENRLGAGASLLKESGSLFLSIDDIEVGHARQVADLALGEQNRVETYIWKKSYGGGPKEKHAVTLHEYVLQYAGNIERLPDLFLPPNEETKKRYYKFTDDRVGTRGPYRLQPLEAAKSMEDRENLRDAISFADGTVVKPKRQWLWSKERTSAAAMNNELVLSKGTDGEYTVNYKQYLLDEGGQERGSKPLSIIDGMFGPQGTARLDELFGTAPFSYSKPVNLLQYLIQIATPMGSGECWVADYFAGSGTTADAVMLLSGADEPRRRFVLVEAAEHFDTILKPRVMKVMHSRDWKDGAPVSRQGTQGVVQVIRLESYDDTLDNLQSEITPAQQASLFGEDRQLTPFGREYLVKYMLEHSTQASASLLDARALEHPFTPALRITLGASTESRAVDVPETFHWLVGMTVTHRERHTTPEVRVSWGRMPDDRKAVTVWRDIATLHGDALEAWFVEKLLPRLADIDVVFINGEQALSRLRPETHRWGLRASEYEFVTRMFPVEG